MIITPVADTSQLRALAPFFENVRPRPYDFLPPVTEESLAGYLRADVTERLGNGSEALVARNTRGACGLLVWRPLAFDSELFGCRVARIEQLAALGPPEDAGPALTSLLARAEEDWRERGIELVYARRRAEELAALWALRRIGFDVMGGWINYGIWLDRWECPGIKQPVFLRPGSPDDAGALEQLASASFTLDRFHADPRISRTRADQLHRFWVKNSLSGKVAEAVLVAENDLGRVIGFLTYNVRDEAPERLGGVRIARVILNAVDTAERGQGVYPQMLANVLLECQGQADFLQVETQTHNYAVQRSWARLGLFPVESGFNLHYWTAPTVLKEDIRVDGQALPEPLHPFADEGEHRG